MTILSLQISTRKRGDVTILDLRGKAIMGFDSERLAGQLEKLVASGVPKLLLNLADLTQLDSSGISAIVDTFVTLQRQAASLKLLRPRGQVRDVLHVVRLLEVIPTFEDEAEALASFRPRGHSAVP